MQNQDYLKVALQAAFESGKIFKQFFGKPKSVKMKNDNPKDLVTEIDHRIEKKFRANVLKKFPGHKIIGEEFGRHDLVKNDLIWIIDPIDGTTNFIQGIPVCCISIALWDQKGPLVGVVYNPVLNYLFTSARGKGAFLNGKKIRVSKRTELERAFGGCGWGRSPQNAAKNFSRLVPMLNKIRTLGSCALELCFAAMGAYDFHLQADISVWDFAASALLVREAGGKITDWQGKKIGLETKNLVASNNYLHPLLLKGLDKEK